MPEPAPEPYRHPLQDLRRQLGLDVRGAQPLRLHDAATLLLPAEDLVVRLVTRSDEALRRATKAVQLTAWLATQGFPAVRPAAADPVTAGEYLITIWYAVPEQPRPDSLTVHTALGRLIRDLHTLPDPPITLPEADPLARLRSALDVDTHRAEPVLDHRDHEFLTRRIHDLDDRYRSMSFPLGIGLIHNDAHPGNLLIDRTSPHGHVLTDWDSACRGPREMDVVLVGAPASRFGDTPDERRAFTTGYGYDIATWPAHQTLRDIRDLHSLAGHIRAAPAHRPALRELHTRVRSLRENDGATRWSTP